MSNKLEQAAINTRGQLIPINTYDNTAPANKYGPTHTRALSDQQTPVEGKGTGIFLDTINGGGSLDINGNPSIVGSGRLSAIALNEGTWGYGPNNHYTAPDTSANVGQVVL